MTDLKPTPSRLALLRAVQRGEVWWYRNFGHDPSAYVWEREGQRGRTVTANGERMYDAGWLAFGAGAGSRANFDPHRCQITEAGRAVLAAHPEEETTGG